jgi:hypothetical protein
LGCAFCNSVFPYLLEDANFDLSIKASLVMLNPVVANPVRFTSSLLLSSEVLAKIVPLFPYWLSALTPGIKP